MQGQQGIVGGTLGGAGALLGAVPKAEGGLITGYADGGAVPDFSQVGPVHGSGAQSGFGQYMNGWAGNKGAIAPASPYQMDTSGNSGAQSIQKGTQQFGQGLGSSLGKLFGGSGSASSGVAIAGDAGEASSLGDAAMLAAQGGNVGSKLKAGGSVPGKAKVAGNSYSNDKVKALLSPGEGVIDRETMADKGPVGHAARTLMAIVEAKKRTKK